jgi:hypothetical protein
MAVMLWLAGSLLLNTWFVFVLLLLTFSKA